VNPDTEEPFTLSQMAAPPRRRTGLIVGIAAGAAALVAATVGVTLAVTRQPAAAPLAVAQQTPTPTPPTSGNVSTATTAPASASSATTPEGPSLLKFGAKAVGPRSTTVAYAYKQPVASNAPKPDVEGFEWGAVDIEVCAMVAGTITRINWHLTYADHTVIDPSNVGYSGFPAPAFPWDERDIAAGGCIRGWLTFAVPHGKKPLTVQYLPRDFAADWQVT